MDWLRISLLIFGVILVAGIWIAHRMRVRGRREDREMDLDDWGDDTGVHIRAHRDDPDIEPVLGEGVSGLDNLLEPEERPVSRTPPQAAAPAAGNERPSRGPASEPVAWPAREPESAPAPESKTPGREPGAESESQPAPGPAPAPRGPRPDVPLVAKRAGAKVASVFSDLKQRVAAGGTPAPKPRAPADDAQPAPPPGRRAAGEHFDDVSEPRVVGRNPLSPDTRPEKILVLHVVAPRNRPFTGVALGAALRRAGLGLGEMSIYHYREEGDPPDGDPLFSAANMVAPGTLGDDDLADMMTPGITLFLQLHACDRPQRAFEVLLETAHVLARDLGGRVLDAQQSTATNQTLAHMREDMNHWLLRHRPDLLRRKAAK